MILVSISDAAYFTHIPASTIRRWIAEGKIETYGRKPYRIDMLEAERVRNVEKVRVAS
jgi:predicted site-specific integrase-resolvase